jgi:hypothetical protein
LPAAKQQLQLPFYTLAQVEQDSSSSLVSFTFVSFENVGMSLESQFVNVMICLTTFESRPVQKSFHSCLEIFETEQDRTELKERTAKS